MQETIDNWTETISGVKFSVRVVPDNDASVNDADCYSAKDVALWKHDEWSFVGVIVSVDIPGLDPEWASASLWATQYGTGDGWSIGRTDLLAYPVRELADEAMGELAKIGDQLAGLMAERTAALASWQGGE
jgi:hypothetical protein